MVILMTERLLNPEEIANRLAIKPATVRSWLRSGKLKGIKVGQRVWRISEAEFRRFLSEKGYIYQDFNNTGELKVAESEAYELDMLDDLIKDLETLSPQNKKRVFKIIKELKGMEMNHTDSHELPAYLIIRETLKKYNGSLSDEILKERDLQI